MRNKLFISLIFSLIIIGLVNCSSAQKTVRKTDSTNKVVESKKKRTAMSLFLDGVTQETKGAVAEAILDYQEALRYDTSAGIYFALAKGYFKLRKMLPAMENIRKALALDSANVSYYHLLGDIYSFEHNTDSAALVYNKIISLDSTNVRAYYLLGQIYEYQKPLTALKIFKKMLTISGPDWNVLLKIAEINENLGKVENTIETIEKLRKVNPTDLHLQKILIDSYIKIKKYDKALELTDDALLTFPDDPALIEFKANALYKQGKFKQAAEWYGKLMKYNTVTYKAKLRIALMFMDKAKDDSVNLSLAEQLLKRTAKDSAGWEVYAYLGEIKLQQKEDSTAIKYFELAAKDAQWNSQLWARLANVLFVDGKYQKIIDEISPVVKNFPDNFFLNLIVGLAYSQLSQNKEGKKYLMKAVELDPNDETALTALGFTLNQLKETDAAIVYLERSLKINPKNIQALGTLGLIYDNRKEYDKCDEVYEKALKIDSTNALLLNNYAYSLSERGIQLERAYRMSKKALDAEPHNSSYLDTYGWILYRLGKYDSAEVYIKKAIEIEKNNATLLEHLGDVYLKLNRKDKALEYWKKAFALDKKNKTLKKKIKENKF